MTTLTKFLKEKDINITSQLNKEDKKILEAMLDGDLRTRQEIADQVGYARGTVSSHLEGKLRRLELVSCTKETKGAITKYLYCIKKW